MESGTASSNFWARSIREIPTSTSSNPDARTPLDHFRAWLQANNTAVMSVLLLVIGAVLLGNGIGGLA